MISTLRCRRPNATIAIVPSVFPMPMPITTKDNIRTKTDFFNFNAIRRHTLVTLRKTNLWHQSKTPRGKFVIVTFNYKHSDTLASIFAQYDITDVVLIHRSDFNNEYTYKAYHNVMPKIKERSINMIMPFPVNITTTEAGDIKAIFGLVLDNLNIIGKALNMEVSFVLTEDAKNIIYSNKSDLYLLLSTTRDEKLYEDYDVSEYFFREIMTWAVPKPDKMPPVKIITSVFESKVWITIVFTLIVMSLSWWLFERLSRKNVNFENFLKFTLTSFALTLYSLTYLVPKNNSLRVLFLFYVIYSLQISTIFQGKLFSALTHPRNTHGITTIEELAKSSLGMIGTKKTKRMLMDYLKEHPTFSKVLEKLITQDPLNITDNLRNIARFKNCSAIIGKTTFLYIFPKYRSKVHLIEHNTGLLELELTLAIRKGHYFLDILNKYSRRISESGISVKLFSDATAPYSNEDMEEDVKVSTLSIYHLNGLFKVWGMGNIEDKPEDCLAQVINKLFPNDSTLYFISDTQENIFVPMTILNPHIILATNTPLSLTLNFYCNYIIYAKDYISFRSTMKTLQEYTIWDRSSSPKGRFLIITSFRYNLESFSKLLFDYDIINSFFFVYNNESVNVTELYSSDLFGEKSGCGQTPKLHSLGTCCQNSNIIFDLNSDILKNLHGCPIRLLSKYKISVSFEESPAIAIMAKLIRLLVSTVNASFYDVTDENQEEILYNHSQGIIFSTVLSRGEQFTRDYDLTNIIYQDQLVWAVPKPPKISHASILDIVEDIFLPNIEASAIMRKGHFFLPTFNNYIRRFSENGFKHKILFDAQQAYVLQVEDSDVALSLEHLMGAFVIWSIGLTLATLLFLNEL
ncbi:hypothetical protein ILUMI_12243 [Ignelater luminosus]|uniref:Ionotropic glutamate receptor C-terminal domain-containing protein n=1 Tax=Ignelater luminosus TaxID=2038154 RepID=A0A8K0CUH8_IGNLU|nr:hypothetical protein ILUMI_12243 [Ignelater luminosus]